MTLRLYGIPEAISAAVCAFPTIDGAVDTVIPTIQSGIPVARIELLDEAQMDAINNYSKLDYKVAPTLFFEFHGTRGRRRRAGRDASRRSPPSMAAAISAGRRRQEERSKLWQARHDAYYAALALRPGSQGLGDRCLRADLAARRMHRRDQAATSRNRRSRRRSSGHVGDGNFHLIFMIDPKQPEEIAEASRLNDRMVDARAWQWTAPAPASTASATARWTSSWPSTARRSTSCAPSSGRSIPTAL